MVMSKGPASGIREEIDLRHLGRPRFYDDTRLFEQSKVVVDTLRRYAGQDL
jgi:hypothetical protein